MTHAAQPTEAQIQAARNAIAKIDVTFAHCDPKWQVSVAKSALAAALSLSQPSKTPVEVKALEWREWKHTRGWQADCAIGQYQVAWLGEFECWQCARPHMSGAATPRGDYFSRHESSADAKAAAQADYETRIRSALVSAPTGDPDTQAPPWDVRIKWAERFLKTYVTDRKDKTLNGHDFTSAVGRLADMALQLFPDNPTPNVDAGEVIEAAKLLEEVKNAGLIYWEPNTERGHIAKAMMIARIEKFIRKDLSTPPAPDATEDGR